MRKSPIWVVARWECEAPPPALATRLAVRPKKVLFPVPITTALISPFLAMLPEYPSSPTFLLTGRDSPVSAAWSMLMYSPSMKRTSAGTTSPSLIRSTSPGTTSAASMLENSPSRNAVALGARPAFNAARASEALRSCQKPEMAL